MARVRFKFDPVHVSFPYGPTRATYVGMKVLKSCAVPVVTDETWRAVSGGGYSTYQGNVIEWRSPSVAWNEGTLAQRQRLVRLGVIHLYIFK